MLQFPYRNLLKPYEYNQTAFLHDLTKRIDAYKQLSEQSERTERFHLPVADRTAGEAIRKILRNSIIQQKENLDAEWKKAYGAGYPFIREETGDREANAVAEEISVTDSSKDGWYHIPDHMCAGEADWEAVQTFEKECRQTGRRIPYAVGKQLEDIFISAKADHKQIWAHRTGLSIDGGDLASIAKHGLAVPAQGHGSDELPELGYTATKFSMTTNGFIHLLHASALEEYKHMRGTVVCLTDENPNIARGYLDPGQVVVYERIRVQALYRHACGQRGDGGREHVVGGQQKHRADSLSAGFHRVAHRLVDDVRAGVRRREIFQYCGFHRAPLFLEALFKFFGSHGAIFPKCPQL